LTAHRKNELEKKKEVHGRKGKKCEGLLKGGWNRKRELTCWESGDVPAMQSQESIRKKRKPGIQGGL